MRTMIAIAVVALLGFPLAAQVGTPPKPDPVKTEQPKQEKPPKPGEQNGGRKSPQDGGATKQDPKKRDPKKVGKRDAKKVGEQDPEKAGKQDPRRDQAKVADAGKDQSKDGTKPKEAPDVVPTGTDPADLKAMKSAQDMLKAEKRLAAMLKAGKIKGIDRVLPFEEIASWPYEDGLKGMPKKLKKLDGKKVMMTGFMLPIDEVENIKEFLLVQSLWSCCYGQPPDINGTVRVVMQGKKRTDYKFEPIKIIGTFRIKPTIEDGFCVDIYQLETSDVQVIK